MQYQVIHDVAIGRIELLVVLLVLVLQNFGEALVPGNGLVYQRAQSLINFRQWFHTRQRSQFRELCVGHGRSALQ